MSSVPRTFRLQEFFRRLDQHRPFRSFEEAFAGLVATLNEVEDDLTGILYDPEKWQTDGRMYPPQRDNWFTVEGRPGVTRMRTKGHHLFIARNGAIEIQTVRTRVAVFSKRGADGRGVWDHE